MVALPKKKKNRTLNGKMLVPRQNTHKCNSATRGLLVIGVVHGTHTQKHTHTQVLRQPRHIVTLRYALRVGLGPFITERDAMAVFR